MRILHAVDYSVGFRAVARLWARQEKDGTWTMFDFAFGDWLMTCASEDEARRSMTTSASTDISEPALGVGEYHPRMWRRHYAPDPGDRFRREWVSSMRAAENLFAEMNDVFRVVEPCPANFGAFGHRLRDLLILAATEVESSWKAVLAANGVVLDRANTTDYVRLASPMRLREWKVALARFTEVPELAPFAGWDATKPTESLGWYHAYNAVKHGRESSFGTATVEHVLNAVAAVFVMVSAQFGLLPHRRDPEIEVEKDEPLPMWTSDFLRIESPPWTAAETYVPPQLDPTGVAAWTPVNAALPPKGKP